MDGNTECNQYEESHLVSSSPFIVALSEVAIGHGDAGAVQDCLC